MALGIAALLAVAVVPPPAKAWILWSSSASVLASKIATPSVTIRDAQFVARPPRGLPYGWSDARIAGFPATASPFAIMSTGNVEDIDDPTALGSTNDLGEAVRGSSERDVTILRIDLSVPTGANCLKFDFKFLSKEVPRNLGTLRNDAFVAELGAPSWTTSGSTVTAPSNFAVDTVGSLVSVNTTGARMTPGQGYGTLFDAWATGSDGNGAATGVMTAKKLLVPGDHSLYLSLFDQGDAGGDSAVFIDGLRAEYVADPYACGAGRRSGTLSPGGTVLPPPASLTLRATVDNTGGGTAKATSWVLSAVGPITISGRSGSPAVTYAEIGSGTYRLGASGGPLTYTRTWSCTRASLSGAYATIAAAVSATCTAAFRYVSPYLTKGAFVVGDVGLAIGSTVTYWAKDWSAKNRLSKGVVITGFKGYASAAPTKPVVGRAWTSTTTASLYPPTALPRYVAVLVASSLRLSGTTVTGNVIRVVLVQRSSTFGVGKVVAYLY